MASNSIPGPEISAGLSATDEKPKASTSKPQEYHPSGRQGYGLFMQIVRGATFGIYFTSLCLMFVSPTRRMYLCSPQLGLAIH